MESLSCELGFSITPSGSYSTSTSVAEQQGDRVSQIFKRLQPDFFVSSDDDTSSSQELEDLEEDEIRITYKPQIPNSTSRESVTEDLSEISAPTEKALAPKVSPLPLLPLLPLTSILKKSKTEKPKASRLHKWKDKIKTSFKRRDKKDETIKKRSLDSVEKQRLQAIINPELNHHVKIDESLTQNLHIYMTLENDQTVQLSYEPLDQYRVASNEIGLTRDEQDILLLHAEPQSVLKEAYEKSQATYAALLQNRKKRTALESSPSKKIQAEADNLEWINDDYIPNAALDELEITKTPSLYILLVKGTGSLMLKYECELNAKSDPEKYQFIKIYTFSRFKEGPELMTSTYMLKRL